ncbi:uncharacterized protein FIBRA_00320 [Fibroporia radiculosa]|uniref:Uncharacterized protein n=1 Tax=Fibroporia radiculosa TaxID=599839 RepID=J7SC10_9APHY|nr:uncharacterized protein FIBRA_00320 [Fibroporia radiculosa]CCL98326.1 predicted protein [Fibroporia radiculosa]
MSTGFISTTAAIGTASSSLITSVISSISSAPSTSVSPSVSWGLVTIPISVSPTNVATSTPGFDGSYEYVTSAEQLSFNRSINAGVYIAAIAWGTVPHSSAPIWKYRPEGNARWAWLSFVYALWAMALVNIACNIEFNDWAWIENTGFNGGAFAYITKFQNSSLNLTAVATGVINLVLADTFLLHRVHVLWRRWYILTAMGILLLVTTAFAIVQCYSVSSADNSFWTGPVFGSPLIYTILAMSLHTLFTILLFTRAVQLGHELPDDVTGQNRTYSYGIKALIVESALPYGFVSLLVMILACSHSTGANVFVPLLVQLQGIVSDLIVMRVVQGHAWSLSMFDDIASKQGRLPTISGQTIIVVTPGGVPVPVPTLEKDGTMISEKDTGDYLA